MNNKLNSLNNLLLEVMLEDLQDGNKCTPGLYQVIRGYLNDNREILDGIPKDSLDFLEDRLSNSIPFKMEAS